MNPEEAYIHAKENGPSEETRKIACEDPGYAYLYARNVDQCPSDDTREAVCRHPKMAYWYAQDIDKGFHEDTWIAIENTEWEEEYKKFVHLNMKKEII